MLKIELSLYTILQIVSVTIVEKMPIYQVLTDCEFTKYNHDNSIQLDLFNLWPDSSGEILIIVIKVIKRYLRYEHLFR